jgi:hypothetical protein
VKRKVHSKTKKKKEREKTYLDELHERLLGAELEENDNVLGRLKVPHKADDVTVADAPVDADLIVELLARRRRLHRRLGDDLAGIHVGRVKRGQRVAARETALCVGVFVVKWGTYQK